MGTRTLLLLAAFLCFVASAVIGEVHRGRAASFGLALLTLAFMAK